MATAVQYDFGHQFIASTNDIDFSHDLVSSSPWRAFVENDTGQTGCDLVITLRRLII